MGGVGFPFHKRDWWTDRTTDRQTDRVACRGALLLKRGQTHTYFQRTITVISKCKKFKILQNILSDPFTFTIHNWDYIMI